MAFVLIVGGPIYTNVLKLGLGAKEHSCDAERSPI